jgi:hypothetical protein
MKTGLLSLVLAASAIAVAALLWPRGPRSYDYNDYICMNCGLEKSEYIARSVSVTNRSLGTLKFNAVSSAMQLTNCSHAWFLYRCERDSSSGGPFSRVRARGHGGSEACYLITSLLGDGTFAKELAAMPRASIVWSNLLAAADTDANVRGLITDWWSEGPARGSFSNLWTQGFSAGRGGIGEPRSETNRSSATGGSGG